jgi:hypothetical protein
MAKIAPWSLVLRLRIVEMGSCSRRASRPRMGSAPSRALFCASWVGPEMRAREGRWSAGRRNQFRAHEARRAPWSGAHASGRSTAAIAVASLETTTGSGPRFAGGICASPSASSSRPAHSGQAGGAPEPPECVAANHARRRRIPLHPPNASGRRPSANGMAAMWIIFLVN